MAVKAGSSFALNSYIQTLLRALNQRGFVVDQNPDLTRWKDCMLASPGIVAANPTFDPAHHDFAVSPGLARQYWLRVATVPASRSERSQVVAVIAFRLIDTGASGSPGGWRDWLSTGKLFSSRLQQLASPVVLHPAEQNWRGRIGHHGGLWVNPEYREGGLAYVLTHLVRAISLRDYNVDHHCGVVLEDLFLKGIPTKETGYGYPRAVPSLDGFIGGAGRMAKLYSTHISRAEMEQQIGHGPCETVMQRFEYRDAVFTAGRAAAPAA